jgi:hypothetical protein
VLLESTFVATLIAGEVERHGIVADEEHFGGVASGELNERILAGQRVRAFGSNHGIGDAIQARHRNQRRLGMEGVGGVHVRHDLVAQFDHVVGHGFGRNLGEAQAGLGIDQAWVDGHTGGVDNFGIARNVDGTGGADGGYFSVLHYYNAIFYYSVGDG